MPHRRLPTNPQCHKLSAVILYVRPRAVQHATTLLIHSNLGLFAPPVGSRCCGMQVFDGCW